MVSKTSWRRISRKNQVRAADPEGLAATDDYSVIWSVGADCCPNNRCIEGLIDPICFSFGIFFGIDVFGARTSVAAGT